MKIIICLLVISLVVFGAPFIGWGPADKCYHDVATDAAKYFGIEPDEYNITFKSGKLINAAGENVEGNFRVQTKVLSGTQELAYTYEIRVRTTRSRPTVVATIFHEMAHAAQHKYNLDLEGRTDEQHAELLAFNALWASNSYWWNAVHMLYLHSFHLKPSEYLTAGKLWRTTLTGSKSVAFKPHAVI